MVIEGRGGSAAQKCVKISHSIDEEAGRCKIYWFGLVMKVEFGN